MKGLIIKDIKNLRSQFKIYLIIMVLWLALGIMNDSSGFFMGAMVMLAVVIPINSLAYDDKVKWNSYALTMPVTRKDLVVSKYILVFMSLFAVVVLTVIGCCIISGNIEVDWLIFVLVIGVISDVILMPIIFKFGLEKGRIIFVGIVVLFWSVVLYLEKKSGWNYFGLAFLDKKICILMLFVIVAAVIVSIAVSVAIYKRKDF